MCIAIRDLRSAVSREATITICKVVHAYIQTVPLSDMIPFTFVSTMSSSLDKSTSHKNHIVTYLLELTLCVSYESTSPYPPQLSEVLGSHFDGFVDAFVPELLRQVVINVKVIADSANLCIRYLIRTSRCKTLIPRSVWLLVHHTLIVEMWA